jgi:hypothetical protein
LKTIDLAEHLQKHQIGVARVLDVMYQSFLNAPDVSLLKVHGYASGEQFLRPAHILATRPALFSAVGAMLPYFGKSRPVWSDSSPRSGLRVTRVVNFHAFWQQAFAAALSAARECRPAGFGSHPGTETVLAFACSFGWLIGAFHKTATPSGSRALTVWATPALSTIRQPNFALVPTPFDHNQASTQFTRLPTQRIFEITSRSNGRKRKCRNRAGD